MHWNKRKDIYRADDLYHKPVVSLVVLGDESDSWRPNFYGYEMGDCRVSLEFAIVKLLDYEQQWSELESALNPFTIISRRKELCR